MVAPYLTSALLSASIGPAPWPPLRAISVQRGRTVSTGDLSREALRSADTHSDMAAVAASEIEVGPDC